MKLANTEAVLGTGNKLCSKPYPMAKIKYFYEALASIPDSYGTFFVRVDGSLKGG